MKRLYTDITDILDDMFAGLSYFSPQSNSYSFRGQIVDTDHYDIIPKKSFTEELIKHKEEELQGLKEQKNHFVQRNEDLQKQKQEEIDTLRKRLKP